VACCTGGWKKKKKEAKLKVGSPKISEKGKEHGKKTALSGKNKKKKQSGVGGYKWGRLSRFRITHDKKHWFKTKRKKRENCPLMTGK